MTPAPPLPRGFGVTLASDTRELSDGSLFGGSPARVMKLTAAGRDALAELRARRERRSASSTEADTALPAGGIVHA